MAFAGSTPILGVRTNSEVIEMSVEPTPEQQAPQLRREALLPNERNRGLGTVAVVCTMAGVASGLALATTLMAMQVADSMSVRACTYHVTPTEVQPVEVRMDHGFLGIRYVFHDGTTEIDSVLPGTPAESVGVRPGDRIVTIDGSPIRSASDLQERIYGSHPGAQPSLVIERDGTIETVHPTLVAWPVVSY
jgi:S1-C subfamily serine protease